MSYTQQRTTESWNNDPNHFSNPRGPDAGFHHGLHSRQQQAQGGGSFFAKDPGEETRPTHDPTDTSTWGTDPTGPRQHSTEGDSQKTDPGQGYKMNDKLKDNLEKLKQRISQ